MSTYSTVDLDSTEMLALRITRDLYAYGHLDIDEFGRRVDSIIGLNGPEERARVLETDEVIDVTGFGGMSFALAGGWIWPEESA